MHTVAVKRRHSTPQGVTPQTRTASPRHQALMTVLVLASTLLPVPAMAAAVPVPSEPARETAAQSAIPNPDSTLGPGWKTSSDVIVTGVGDTTGFHVIVAKEKDAFAWSTLATLNAGMSETGAWTGYLCVTGSGRYAMVVYAPAIAANRPAALSAGAFAATVNLATGRATRIAARVQLAYFNPSCGPGDRVLLTRAIGPDQQRTDLLSVDAATGRIASTRRIEAQLTNPVPAPDGDYGVVRGSLVRVSKGGTLTRIGTPGGQPFAVRATAAGAIDLLTVQRTGGTVQDPQERAVAYRYAGGRQIRVGDAPRTALELFGMSGGRNALVGEVGSISAGRFTDLSAVRSAHKARAVSRQGHLVALKVSPPPGDLSGLAAAGAQQRQPDVVQMTVQATRTGATSAVGFKRERKAAADTAAKRSPMAARALDDEWTYPNNPGPPACAVGRNDVRLQVPQPSANQAEWAVDLAVRGKLKIQRPANYLFAGNPAYTPQGMFPLPPSGPRVPAQIMLAILAQETNMYQATWKAVPGDTGNPLVSDYYGLRAGEGAIEDISYPDADCGYGIAQVTDGMRAGQTTLTRPKQVAIATDYAANIAAGLQILIQKWNQLQAISTRVNNNDPRYIENWYLAVWGYNSGVHPNTGGDYGVGFLNNPANPSYRANREPFLRTSLDDASHPADWTYPEKIMGWVEVPQWQWIIPTVKYAQPHFGTESGEQLSLPGRYAFCGPVNNCNPDWPGDPCPAWNSSCWWHGQTSWLRADAPKAFATESLTFAATDPEPMLYRVYPPACRPFPEGGRHNAVVVDDMARSQENLLGCPGQPWGGKFTIRTGYPPGSVFSDFAQVDLHQLGAGHMGHSWNTHAYDPDMPLVHGTAKNYHQVIGTWTPDLVVSGRYKIFAHLQSHGAAVTNAEYVIKGPDGTELGTCVVDQSATQDTEQWRDLWVHLGTYPLAFGSRVQLSNLIDGTDGTVNVGFDAMAFVPDDGNSRPCNEFAYPG